MPKSIYIRVPVTDPGSIFEIEYKGSGKIGGLIHVEPGTWSKRAAYTNLVCQIIYDDNQYVDWFRDHYSSTADYNLPKTLPTFTLSKTKKVKFVRLYMEGARISDGSSSGFYCETKMPNGNAGNAVLEIPEDWYNVDPIVSLATINNKTLYENDSITIDGTTTDTDNGDVVTVKYQIDSGAVRNLHSGISNGTTPILFSKNLTYSEGILKDGSTALTSVLSKDSAHVISVWAEDDNGGKSTVETRTFYVVPNRPPSLSVDPIAAQSNLINSNVIPVNGTVVDLDNNDVVVIFQINDSEPQKVHDGAPGAWAFNIMLKDLRTGSNTIVIKAVDIYGASISKVLTINKTHNAVPVDEAIALYKINPPTSSAQKILMWIERMIGDLAVTAEVSMTNEDEPENFVPLPKTNSGPKEGLTEDEFAYDALAPKTNIVVKIKYSRTNSAAVAAIKKISGVLS